MFKIMGSKKSINEIFKKQLWCDLVLSDENTLESSFFCSYSENYLLALSKVHLDVTIEGRISHYIMKCDGSGKAIDISVPFCIKKGKDKLNKKKLFNFNILKTFLIRYRRNKND